MLRPVWSGRFARDVKRAEKRGKELDKLKVVIRLLAEEAALPARYNDHPLKGDSKGYRDLHIEPDWPCSTGSTATPWNSPAPEPTPTCSTIEMRRGC